MTGFCAICNPFPRFSSDSQYPEWYRQVSLVNGWELTSSLHLKTEVSMGSSLELNPRTRGLIRNRQSLEPISYTRLSKDHAKSSIMASPDTERL
jgi:hypothetical protein